MDNLKILAPEDYLMHYGIEGQKWGIRRFQNADGTLTPAGRARYGYTGKKYGERVKTNMALGMTKEKAEQEAYKTTNRNSKIAQGFRTYIASGNAAATALYSTAAIAGGVAGVPAGWVAAVIGTPAVTAAAVGGYSIYRHFKNKKFQEGIRNNLTDSKKTEDKKFVDTIVGAGVNGRPSVMYKKSAVLAAGSYQHCPLMEDTLLWVNMFKNGAVAMNIDDFLVNARIGKGMYERRGGWAYYKKYKQARKRIYETGYISWWDYEYTLLVQLVVALMPNKLRGFVFKKILHR